LTSVNGLTALREWRMSMPQKDRILDALRDAAIV